MKGLLSFSVLLIFFSCSQKYDFNVENDKDGLVVEASISDKSFMESLTFPSDGRYFQVKLTKTTRVDNVRDEKIKGAKVLLVTNDGRSWQYEENKLEPGSYYLKDDFFEVELGKSYKLKIGLEKGQHFESYWEKMPVYENNAGLVDFSEVKKDVHKWIAGERVIKSLNGINVRTQVPKSTENGQRFFKWSFDPMWVYRAELTDFDSPVRYCWIRATYFLQQIALQKDKGNQSYDKALFFLETSGNEFVYHYFSALIHQEMISEGYYQFWVDFEAQKDKGGLYDQPPFGLPTNIKALDNDWTVNGYFGVVSESAFRWEFTKDMLSYNVENNLKEICEEITDSADQCVNCLLYNQGTPTNIPPTWWTRKLN